MKNIAKMVQKHIKSAGGKKMHSYDLDAKKFSIVKSDAMFPEKDEKDDDIEEAKEKTKETHNPSKNVKPLKKMKGKEKGKGKK